MSLGGHLILNSPTAFNVLWKVSRITVSSIKRKSEAKFKIQNFSIDLAKPNFAFLFRRLKKIKFWNFFLF